VVQHDLEQRHEGDGQPDHLSVTRVLLACLVAAGVALASGACGLFASEPVVLVSGRDDHGLIQWSHLGLRKAPDDEAIVATVRDGTFARIRRSEGTWRLVRTVEREPQEGWIDDHYLRGVAADLARRTQVTFVDAAVREGEPMVLARPRSGGEPYWIRAAELREVGAR
jgi:hypothetical protein